MVFAPFWRARRSLIESLHNEICPIGLGRRLGQVAFISSPLDLPSTVKTRHMSGQGLEPLESQRNASRFPSLTSRLVGGRQHDLVLPRRPSLLRWFSCHSQLAARALMSSLLISSLPHLHWQRGCRPTGGFVDLRSGRDDGDADGRRWPSCASEQNRQHSILLGLADHLCRCHDCDAPAELDHHTVPPPL
jgi:hypothetical protein